MRLMNAINEFRWILLVYVCNTFMCRVASFDLQLAGRVRQENSLRAETGKFTSFKRVTFKLPV